MASCPHCHGSGTTEGEYPSCLSCGGSGYLGSDTQARCTRCAGTGHGPTRSVVSCGYCAGTGRDPNARRKPAGSRSRGSSSGAASAGAGRSRAATSDEKFETFAAGVLGALWALYFIFGFFTFSEEWVPFAIAGVAGVLTAALWRLAVHVAVVAGVFVFVWILLATNGAFTETWVPLALAAAAAALSLYLRKLAELAFFLAGFAGLFGLVNNGISPSEFIDGARLAFDTVVAAAAVAAGI